MKEQTRIRLSIIEARYGARRAVTPAEAERVARIARFEDDFRRVRDALVMPLFKEIGAALLAAGHGHRVLVDAGEHAPNVELHLSLRGAPAAATNVIRVCTVSGDERSEIIADVNIGGTWTELRRFMDAAAMTDEVLEQMIVDAVEQVFACRYASG
jgi:hypothetical protein